MRAMRKTGLWAGFWLAGLLGLWASLALQWYGAAPSTDGPATLQAIAGSTGGGTSQATPAPPTPNNLPCLSYAPFRRPGHTPTDPNLRLSDDQLLEDLRILARLTRCIRVYGTSHGQDRIPALAGSLGLQVVMGAWISRDRAASQREVDTTLAVARAHPDVVKMILIGNEVLLRQERSAEDLAALVNDARQRSPVPVGYADVWEFWLRHAPVMAPAVDVAAIHILPYWEDEPVALGDAVSHVAAIHAKVRKALPHTPIWLAETGWPAAGRQRGPALPGPQEQALFVRQAARELSALGMDFNLIEAFDQPWKRQLEGGMGGAWGIIDATGRIKDSSGDGPLPADPMAVGAVTGAACGLLWTWLLAAAAQTVARRQGRACFSGPGSEHVMTFCAGTTAGLLLGAHTATMSIALRTPGEWALAIFSLIAVVAVGSHGIWRAHSAIGGHTAGDKARSGAWWHAARLGDLLLILALFLAAQQALTLVFDGRYRPLPALLWAAMALPLWLAAARGARWATGAAARLLAAALVPCALALMWLEGWANTQAGALAAAWCVMAAAVWMMPHQRPPLHVTSGKAQSGA